MEVLEQSWEFALGRSSSQFSLEWVWCALKGGEVAGFVHGFIFNGGRGLQVWQRLEQALAEVAVSGEAMRDVRELVWMVWMVAEVVVVAEVGRQRQ